MASRRMLTQGDPGYAEMIAKLTAGAMVPQAMIDTYNTQAQNYNQQMADKEANLAQTVPGYAGATPEETQSFKGTNLDDYIQSGQLPPALVQYVRDDIAQKGIRNGMTEVNIPGIQEPLHVQVTNGGLGNINAQRIVDGKPYNINFSSQSGKLTEQAFAPNDQGGFFSDLKPMLLAGLGANLFTGANLLGGAAGATDAVAGTGLRNLTYGLNPLGDVAQGVRLGGGLGLTGASAGAGTIGAGLGNTLAGITTGVGAAGLGGTPLGSVGGQNISQLQSQLANTPMPQVTSGPPIAGEPVPGSLPGAGEVISPEVQKLINESDLLAKANQVAQAAGQFNPSAGAGSFLNNLLPQSLQDLLPTTPAGMGALLSGAGNVASGLIGGNAAQKAAQTQADAATRAAQMQQEMFNTVNAQGAPYRAQGYNALNQIGSMLPGQYTQYDASGKPIGQATGSGYLTQQFGPEQFAAGMDPGYAFRLQQGQMANQRASNLAGGLIGGNALKGMQDYTQGMASQEYGNAFNRFQTQRGNIYNTLAGIAGIGQTAQGQANQMAQNNATAQGQLGVGSAAAQAAGQIGQANAYGGAATGAGNAYLLSQLLKQNQGVAIPPP
jgi:hypothetical protein